MTDSNTRAWIARRPAFIPLLIPAAMCVVALGYMPYDFYVMLRWVVVAAGVIIVARALVSGQHAWILAGGALIFVYGLIGLVLIPSGFTALDLATWRFVNIITVLVVVSAGASLRARGQSMSRQE